MPFQVEIGRARWRLKSIVILFLIILSTEVASSAAEPRDYAVEVSVEVLSGPFAIQLSWPGNDLASQYVVRRRRPGETVWGNPIATLPASATGYTDFAVVDGAVYEFEVRMQLNVQGGGGEWLNAYSYLYAGGNVPAPDSKGKALMVVDSSVSAALANELAVFQRDLIGAGWAVVRRDVSRTASPVDVRNQIKAEHDADPFNLRTVVLIGHVPVPYSGNVAPDLHESHRGAWPADGFYGELDGTWTDSTVNVTSFDNEENDNRPGDGKFDQSQFPSAVDLEVGRIDFWNLPAFGARSEVDLLRNYFRKNHEFRHRGFTAARRGLIRDNFGDLNGDAPAVDAWRHYTPFFGRGNVREAGPGGFLPTLSAESFLWAYGCGGGGFAKADGVGTTYDFAASDPQAVFLILHGSYFGDWNIGDNFLRAAAATPNYTLASIWSGLPHWFMHPMGLGANIGYCTRIVQNNIDDYKSHRNLSPNQVHISLIGDPTLEMFPVVPPSNLTAAAGPVVSLNWTGAAEENLAGYHVYYATNPNGPFQRLTSAPVNATSYAHSIGAGTYHYMVRSLKLERTGSGTFYNLSQGITATVTQGSGGTVPTVSVITADGEAAETAGNPAEFRFTRSGAVEFPLSIDILIGGTAQNGVDYQAFPAAVTIPAGSAEWRVPLNPIADGTVEGEETVTLQIRPSGAYTVGTPSVGFVRILDGVVNAPPSISAVSDQSLTTAQGSVTVGFQINDAETAPANLNVRALSSNLSLIPQSGLAFGGSGANRSITLTPATGATGTSTITLLVSDGTAETSRTFNVSVIQANLPPTAQSQSVTTVQNTPVAIMLTGSDPEGAPLSFVLKLAPNRGVLSGTAPNLIYTPFAGFTGQDSLIFSTSDGQAESAAATVTIQVAPTNRPPVAVPQEIVINEDTSGAITLQGSDPDGDALVFELVSGTTKGVLTGRGANYSYTPIANANGTDSFMFRVSDGTNASAPATVSITITPINDPPAAGSATVQAVEDQVVQITLAASDPDRDVLTFQLLSAPTKGQITGTPPNLTFTPSLNASGPDSFTFKVTDGITESGIATISLVIAPVNDAPSATGQSVSTSEDTALSIHLGGSDPDGNPLAYRVLTPPQKGQVSGVPPDLSYTPNPDANGADSFSYVANDGTVDSAPAVVLIQVEPRNDPPVISALTPQSVSKNAAVGPLAIFIEDVDKPIGELLVSAASSEADVVRSEHIQIAGSGTNRSVTVTPERGATGATEITITVSDGEATAQSRFLVTVTNTPPVANPDSVSTDGTFVEIPPAQLTGNDTDADGDVLRIVAVSLSARGRSVELSNNLIVYRAEAGIAEDSFTYTLEDSSGATATGRVTVTVTLREAPVIESISVSGSGIVVRVNGAPLSQFQVESSADLRTWTVAGEGTTDAAGRGEFRGTDSGSTGHQFYRVELR
jgi:hypothetical protein